jgi:sortase A
VTARACTAPPPWPARVLGVVIALLLGVAGGVVAAQLREPAPAGERPAEVVAAGATPAVESAVDPSPARPDPAVSAEREARVAARLVSGLSAPLPAPEQVPADPRAPTPEIQHGILELPSIGVAQPLFEGVTLTAIDRGPSHWPGTPMPGELGNVVIAGHRTTYTRPFWDLDLLQPGDPLIFDLASGDRHVYELERTEVVDEEAMHIVDQSYGYRATLFACHPKGSAQQRIVGHFRLVESDGVQVGPPVATPSGT